MKYTIILGFLILITACERQSPTKKQERSLTMAEFSKAYGLKKEIPDLTLMQNIVSGVIYSQIKNELDLTDINVFSTGNSLIYVVRLKQADKFYAFRAVKGKPVDELLYSSKVIDSKNGTFGILKNGEALTVEFKNGKRFIKAMTEEEYKINFAKIDTADGFCQRQPGQSFGNCYEYEVHEFCDSFFSCLAINTQPQIHILIGLACSCNA